MAATVDHNWIPGERSTLYVHVPFCVVKCGYCDFNSYADPSDDSHAMFLRALDRELAMLAPIEPTTVFLGGGTPTYLAPARFAELFTILARHVDLGRCVEVTVEANPESLTRDKAAIAYAAGVRRCSVGAQSFQPERLRFLDRAHDADAVVRAVSTLRETGFENVSLDLMYGLPRQSPAEWQRDLDAALALSPDHLSCYNLTFEPGTRLTRDMQRGRVAANDPDDDLVLFWQTRDLLLERGFDAYEISNFAGRGGPCLHNDHYWLQGDYEGVGPGAASHHAGERTSNLKVVKSWAEAISRGERPIAERERLDGERRAAEAIWLGLRRRDGVDLAQIEARTGFAARTEFEEVIDGWVERGWLTLVDDRLALTRDGLPLGDTIAEAFLRAPS